jgi:DNA-binding CsgD family transcriptional regulator
MSDATLDSVFIMLCDWRGHINWSSRKSSVWKTGDFAWTNLTRDAQQNAKTQFAQVVALRETRSLEVTNQQGIHYRCWIWPLESPEMAACILGKQIPVELSRLTNRERQCVELLAQGVETRDVARELDVSVSTIHTHLKRAREKLGLPNVESLISFGARHCYPPHHPLVRHQA